MWMVAWCVDICADACGNGLCILTASVPSQFTEPTECDGVHDRLRNAKVKLLDSILKRLEKLVNVWDASRVVCSR